MRQLSIVWFRKDLRLRDNPALYSSRHDLILPIFVFDDESGSKNLGGAGQWWLHHSLQDLDRSLGGHLNVYRGNSADVIAGLAKKLGARFVRWNRNYEFSGINDEKALMEKLNHLGVQYESFNGGLLWEPNEILKPDQTQYRVFTPFYKKALSLSDTLRSCLPQPKPLKLVKDSSNTIGIDNLELIPKIPWYKSLEKSWKIGEEAAQKRLTNFLRRDLEGYGAGRDFMNQNHTSRLSPHLHWGEISALEVFHRTKAYADIKNLQKDADAFLRELIWREFSYYLLSFFPKLDTKNYNNKFDEFPWDKNRRALAAWQQGKTGIPLVDAGMRELIATGFMHNRARMIVASFLVKNLRIDWRRGAQWFLDYLVDADIANNSMNWQWIAGSGVDAAPYFRIFNPVTQGEKFDPEGKYTRKWIPELKKLSLRYLFRPWDAPAQILKEANIKLGENYPYPIVDLPLSRLEALSVYQRIGKR